jgi:hypothetical protein
LAPAAQPGSNSWYQNAAQTAAGYDTATRGAVADLASDTWNAVKGAISFISPKPQSGEEQTAFDTAGIGGMYAHRLLAPLAKSAMSTLDIADAVHDINQSKDPTGTYLEIARKTASQGAAQALVALGTAGAAKAAPYVPDIVGDVVGKTGDAVTDITQGVEKAQAPAQAALRTGAAASTADAGVAASDTTGSIRTLLDKPIADLATKEAATYADINEASGTDLKSLYDLRTKLQDGLEDPTQIANEDKLSARLDQTEAQIKSGESQATANGVDPKTLADAKAQTQQRYAMEDVAKKIFNNKSVVKGNVAASAPESINVDSAIGQVEDLDNPSRFAPRGTPSRLQQAFGEDGAAQLKQGLYDAQKAGQTAIGRQQLLAKTGKVLTGVGVVGGAGYEAVKHLM